MNDLLLFAEGINGFLYCVEDGEKLVDVACKFSVPLKKLAEDNYLTEEVIPGQIIYVSRGNAVMITPEEAACRDDLYPFMITEK